MSLIFSELEQGRAPVVNYSINSHEYKMGYYLVDGIYPKWSTFVKTILSPHGQKKKKKIYLHKPKRRIRRM